MSVDNVKIWYRMMNINLAVSSVTTKSPNLNPTNISRYTVFTLAYTNTRYTRHAIHVHTYFFRWRIRKARVSLFGVGSCAIACSI